LGETLKPRYASLNEVVVLCLRQIQYGELSRAVLKERLSKLPAEPKALEEAIGQCVEEICQEAANSRYVRDCERVAQFLSPCTSDSDGREIVWQYRAEYAAWTYGREDRTEGEPPGGCLGARLVAYLGKRETSTRFAEGQDKLDTRVFSVEGFADCARQYRPAAGRKFENFFKQWIGWRCGDVAREMRRGGPPGGRHVVSGTIDRDAILAGIAPAEDVGEDDARSCSFTTSHRALEAYRRQQVDQAKATLEIAAFELRYRAYLDPASMTAATQQLVKQHLSALRDEFLACQERLRELEEELRGTEYDCDIAWEQAEERRQAMENEGCRIQDIDELQRTASERNKTEMEKELRSLRRGQRAKKDGLRMQCMIAYKALALARGRLELRRKEWEKWAGCRKPWVRSQEEVGGILGVDQVTASRYIAAVKGSIEPRMKKLLESCE